MSMERAVLQYMGAFTDVQDAMQFYVYGSLEDHERAEFSKKTPTDKILQEYKRVFRNKFNVAVPQQISDIYKGAQPLRNDLAHLLEIESISGESPQREMVVIRYDNYTSTEHWHHQSKRRFTVAEQDLWHWTDKLRHCRRLMNVLDRIAGLNLEFDLSDDHLIDTSWIPWWDGRWGKPPEFGEERRAPIGRYRATTNPRRYWAPKDQWHKF
ncbi:hypothetical protein [Rhodococcus pyridinivorans]|uniref:Uncharacterized protein n=2 Tax=Rhodococcus pyridinivorans TaxID=103816 RepID=A0A7M2XRW6_9NOCA|nr:hypothetical protein [Rhodococcus pyridinivorans]QOW00617.1 hypothetical protein INP59_10030 [Rhodococcus pyridinivorans]